MVIGALPCTRWSAPFEGGSPHGRHGAPKGRGAPLSDKRWEVPVGTAAIGQPSENTQVVLPVRVLQ